MVRRQACLEMTDGCCSLAAVYRVVRGVHGAFLRADTVQIVGQADDESNFATRCES
jgi:hypothetical protein